MWCPPEGWRGKGDGGGASRGVGDVATVRDVASVGHRGNVGQWRLWERLVVWVLWGVGAGGAGRHCRDTTDHPNASCSASPARAVMWGVHALHAHTA